MLAHLAHDVRRFFVGGLLPIQWTVTAVAAAAWGSLLARFSPDYQGAQSVPALWAAAPYDFVCTVLVPLLLIVNAGVRMGWDYTQGTEKYELLAAPGRRRALAAHGVFLAGSTLVTYACAAVGYLAVPALSGRPAGLSAHAAAPLLTGIATVWAGTLPLVAMLVLAGLVVRSLEGLVALGLLLLALLGSSASLAGPVAWIVPTALMVRSTVSFGPTLPLACLTALTAACAACAISLLLYPRKDILR